MKLGRSSVRGPVTLPDRVSIPYQYRMGYRPVGTQKPGLSYQIPGPSATLKDQMGLCGPLGLYYHEAGRRASSVCHAWCRRNPATVGSGGGGVAGSHVWEKGKLSRF